jgi:UDP:flavonoid glycosyltransferase YjiC (YdhE family)
MRLTATAFGSRGDITPVVALCARLRAEGHAVRLASHPEFESLARQHALDFHPVPGSYQELLSTVEGRRALGVPTNSPFGLRGLFASFREAPEAVYRACWDAAVDAEGIVSSTLATLVGGLIAARRGLPLAVGMAVPTVPTVEMPYPVFAARRPRRIYNRLTWWAGTRIAHRAAAPVFAAWNREAERLQPGPVQPPRSMVLLAVSPRVVPKPPDWPASVHVTGFWFLPSATPPLVDDDLRRFLEDGPPPLCVGFGSMADNDPDELRAIVLDTLDRLRMRAVIVSGSGGALVGFEADPRVYEARFADYGWLFPRVAAVVHQGGVGTASYCLRAGTPHVAVPYCLDHAFWASRLHALGVAPPAIGRHRLTAGRLASAVRRVLDDPRYRAAARALAPRIEAEDGLGTAVALAKAHFGVPGAQDATIAR